MSCSNSSRWGERLAPVDAVDVDQRAVALAAARRSRRARHLVARAQLAPADLRSGDVHVVGARLEPAQAQEPVALGSDLERPGHLFGGHVGERLALRLALGLRLGLATTLRLWLGRGLRLCSRWLARSAAGLDFVDELFAAQASEARHIELRGELMKIGQMELCEPVRHRLAVSGALRDQAAQPLTELGA